MSVMTPGGMAAELYFQSMLTLQCGTLSEVHASAEGIASPCRFKCPTSFQEGGSYPDGGLFTGQMQTGRPAGTVALQSALESYIW